MVSTGPDWSYTWNAFTPSFPPCIIDTYDVTCAEGAHNFGSNLCSRGFQYNKSLTSIIPAALNSVTIPKMTILAQYDETTQISVDHEGEFTFTITAYKASTPTVKGSFSITLKIKTPCNNPLNSITTVTQTFVGNCRTANGKTFCDDIHYDVFKTQSNPIVPYTVRFSYSCQLTYTLKQKVSGVEQDAPPFITLKDSNGPVSSTTNPKSVDLYSVLNSDRDYSNTTLVLKATVQQFAQQTEFKLFVYSDCSPQRVPMLNTGQTLNTSFTVSQQKLTGIESYINFNRVSAVNASDQKYCVVSNLDLQMRQLNKPASITNPYNALLFEFLPDQVNNNNRIRIRASKDSDVVTAAGPNRCELSNLSTNSCIIEFEITAKGANGTYPLAATGKVDFKTECQLTLMDFDKKFGETTDKWFWESSDQTLFKEIYQIHKPQVILNLPRLKELSIPSIDAGSGKTFEEVCGAFIYSLTTPYDPFNLVQPSFSNQPPTMQVFSDDPLHANKEDPVNFARSYALDLRVSNPRAGVLMNYAITPVKQEAMTYQITDQCYGLTYSKPQIFYADGRNSPRVSNFLYVSQPVLFDVYEVKFFYQTFQMKNGEDPEICGKVAYSGKHDGDSNVIRWGKINSKQMEQPDGVYFNLYASDNKYRGTYSVTLTASLRFVPGSNLYPKQDSIITVSIDDCYVKSFRPSQPNPPSFFFSMFGQPQQANFKNFVQIPACNYTQSYNFTAFKQENGTQPEFEEGRQPSPNPFQYDENKKRITFETKLNDLVNSTYQFYISGRLSNSLQHQQQQVYHWGPFYAYIVEKDFFIQNSSPIITGFKAAYTVYRGETSTVEIGQIFDLEGHQVSLNEWKVTDFAKNWIKLSSTVDSSKLSDLSFDLEIPQETPQEDFALNFQLADNSPRQPAQADFIANFKVASRGTSQGFIPTNSTKSSQEQQQVVIELPPQGIPKKISISGGFVFEFDKPIEMERLVNITKWNSTNAGKEYFDFSLVPGDETYFRDNVEKFKYEWTITNTTKTSITFQFIFQDYDIISQRETDSIRFKILKPQIFVSKTSGKGLQFTSSLQSIPKQVRDVKAEKEIKAVAQNLERILQTISASSFINIILSTSLQFLWGMINSLQIIVYSVLFNLNTPVNALEIEIMILQMVQFDVLRTDQQLQKIFKFDLERTPSLNSRFEKAQYETSNFVLNMGSMFLIECVYLLLLIIVPTLKRLCIRQSTRIENYLQKVKLFNSFARFYLESMLEISICAIMTFKLMKGDTWKQAQLVFSNFWAFGNLCVLTIMPVVLGYVALQFHKKFDTDWDYRKKYDDIFSELRGRNKPSMLYFTFFTLRRYAFAIILIAIPNKYIFQIFVQIFSSSLFLLYILDTKPHKDPKQGKIEVFNELTISAACYWLFIFTDFCPDSTRRYQAGWAKILLIVINLVVNVSIMMFESFFVYKLKIKTWWMRRKRRLRLMARLESQVASQSFQIDQQPQQAVPEPEHPSQIMELQVKREQQTIQNNNMNEIQLVLRRDPTPQQVQQEAKILQNFYSQFPQKIAPQQQNPDSVQQEAKLLQNFYSQFPRKIAPQQQNPDSVQQEAKLLRNFYSQFPQKSAPQLYNPQTKQKENKDQSETKTLIRSETPQTQKQSQHSQNDIDESDTDLVMPSQYILPRPKHRVKKLSMTPVDVIEEYNNKRELERQLFGNVSNRHRVKKPQPQQSNDDTEILKDNKWLKSGAKFLPKEPDWFYQDHPDYKAAKDYLDKKYNWKE